LKKKIKSESAVTNQLYGIALALEWVAPNELNIWDFSASMVNDLLRESLQYFP
jgi:hypothetical protein